MLDDRTKNDLLFLFSEYTEGRLNEEQEKELAELLRSDSEARSLYVKHRSLEAKLRRRFGRLAIENQATSCNPSLIVSAEADIVPDLSGSPDPVDTICDLSELDPESVWGITTTTEDSDKNESGSPILSFLGDIFSSGSSFIGRNMTLLIVLLPIMAIATVIAMSPTLWRSPGEGWTIVARVRQTTDCQWKKNCKKFEGGDFLIAEQPLNLQRGVVELEFYSGAKVILQGPARFTTKEKNLGQLDFGRLAANVPEKAHGFAVQTPSLDVTDLGTEFGLFVDAECDSDVHVFKGEVRVETNPSTGPEQEAHLTEKQAICFDSQTGKVEKRSADSRQFVCNMDDLWRPLDYVIENHTLLPGTEEFRFIQSRATLLPHDEAQRPEVLIITQHMQNRMEGHPYQDLFQVQSEDLGFSWTKPKRLPSLRRKEINANHDERVIGDFWPKLHHKSGVVLGTGKTFTFLKGEVVNEDPTQEQVSYSVYDATTNQWSGLNLLDLPERDHFGAEITEPNAGCSQRFDLPDGDVLLPIRYRRGGTKERVYTSIVARCGFDGKKLTYKEHGSEMTIDRDRGLYEPSIAKFNDHYYLTLRADHNGFITRSKDGIHFEPIREWTFDDGTSLVSENTQQHWVTHSDGLFLVYTRAGANNDHIIRHRAPLFIAQIDPERLCVVRNTERILVPENNAAIGNFGVTDVTPMETWVVTAESPVNGRPLETAKTIVAKIYWSKPNMAMEP